MTNHQRMVEFIESYFREKSVELTVETNLHDASKNDDGQNTICYLYDKEPNLEVIDMDKIAKDGYKVVKCIDGNPISTADAFIVNKDNDWYFIEFKDTKVNTNSMKNNAKIV